MVKRKFISIIISFIFIGAIILNTFFSGPLIKITKAAIGPGDERDHWDNSTTINITILEHAPRINWYDFQYNDSGNWVSKRNAQIDIDNSKDYRFVLNISSDQGWDDINYINITAWHDNGSETTQYNETNGGYGNLGGNRNFRLTYENLSGTAYYNMTWPDNEISKGTMTETISRDDTNGSQNYTECYNISFTFTPGYQFRYAPGENSGWANTTWSDENGELYAKPLGASGNYTALDNIWSWNFWINVTDGGESNSDGPMTTWVKDEFGVYSYSEIASVGWPIIHGVPGENKTADSNITIVTRSNGNYSLSVNATNLTHKSNPSYTISNESIWIRGANLTTSANFSHDIGGSNPIYLWANSIHYNASEANGTHKTASNIEYKCNITLGQQVGEYRATIYYHLKTQS